MARHESLYFECDAEGLATGPVDHDLADDEEDTRLPDYWVEMTLRRVIPNPERVAEDAVRSELASKLIAEAASQGQTLTQEDADAAALMQIPIDETQHIVEEIEGHLSPHQAETIFKQQLGYLELWFEEPPAAVDPAAATAPAAPAPAATETPEPTMTHVMDATATTEAVATDTSDRVSPEATVAETNPTEVASG